VTPENPRRTGSRLAVLAAGAVLLPATATLLAPAAATAAPTPSPGAATIERAGTSFLTATPVGSGQPVRVAASTGDYLYWSFSATAGQTRASSSIQMQ